MLATGKQTPENVDGRDVTMSDEWYRDSCGLKYSGHELVALEEAVIGPQLRPLVATIVIAPAGRAAIY